MWTRLTSRSIKGMTSLKSFPQTPTASHIVEQFSTPKDAGITYGQRLYGYFMPPETGNYIFATSCTDECQLSLSKTDEESKKDVIITHAPSAVQDQSSEPISLKGGHTYFVEALSFHGHHDAPMKVGVRMPSGKIMAPIPSTLLRLQRGGLVDEEYDDLSGATVRSLLDQSLFPDSPTKWNSLDDFSMSEYRTKGNHGHRVSGYFLAKESGTYKFFGTCPSGCRLYLSEDDTCNKRSLVLDYKPPRNSKRSELSSETEDSLMKDIDKIISLSHHTATNENIRNSSTRRGLDLPSMFEVSKTFDLQAGLYYYIEALQAMKGKDVNGMKIGAVLPSGKTYFPIKKDLLKQFTPSKHGVVREVWNNIKGENLRDFLIIKRYPQLPNEVNLLPSFEAPANERFNYGQRLKGFFVAPMTGDYRFVMSCDRKCEFWMSPTEHPDHKKKLLSETKRTKIHEYNKYPDQQVSTPVHMDIGQQYYIEATHKAATGLDHMSVGVTLPDGKKEWPIPKKYLRFRPKEKFTSNIEVPCNYNNDDDDDVQSSHIHTRTNHVKEPSDERQAHNDLAILGEGDEGERFESQVIKEEQPRTTNATTKVKVTRLELPFGKPDKESATEALDVMKKIHNTDKVKIQKSLKGSEFTLTGLPSNLDASEVTKIAKGVASVIEESSGDEAQNRMGENEEPAKAKLKPAPAAPAPAPVVGLVGENGESTAQNDHLAPNLHTVEGSNDKILESLLGSAAPQAHTPEAHPAANQPIHLIGNLANQHLQPKVNPQYLTPNKNTPSPAAQDFKTLCSRLCGRFQYSLSPHPCQVVCSGDSIGTPVSDMLPGLSDGVVAGNALEPGIPNANSLQEPSNVYTGTQAVGNSLTDTSTPSNTLTDTPPVGDSLTVPQTLGNTLTDTPEQTNNLMKLVPDDTTNADTTLAGAAITADGVTGTPVTVAGTVQHDNPSELPISQLTDYHILDVDLEGLNSLKKMGGMQQTAFGKSKLKNSLQVKDTLAAAEGRTLINKFDKEIGGMVTSMAERKRSSMTRHRKVANK